ncbi:MAG TPA: D-alanine--D-alanine ligase family protein [Solirubrobacteraceae bacterium]|jgi:D-alanine-D-alanine ligase|nr:D-alanine--D-alanine ligase family protein [Solirubrobacteraceae bacterium]
MSTDAPARLAVAVLAGGRSSEHEISLSSAQAVCRGLELAGHEPRWIEIGRDGVWRYEGERLSVCPGGGLLGVDVVFPVLHGPFGEDGTVQGALETLDVAYVGAGVAASALCMDKVLFKELMGAAGVPQVDYVGVRRERWERAPAEVSGELAQLGLPVFVKPAHLGSSVGIAKVRDIAGLGEALERAFAYDPLVIVEAMSRGIEVECAVLGLPRHERPAAGGASNGAHPPAPPALVSEPGEIVFAGDWYDHEAKYAAGGMELVLPARISAAASVRVRELALEAFAYAGCEGLARVDFFVEDGAVLVNELNTMPGFTPTSVYARLIEASGVPYPELVDRLCRLALERYERRRAHSY